MSFARFIELDMKRTALSVARAMKARGLPDTEVVRDRVTAKIMAAKKLGKPISAAEAAFQVSEDLKKKAELKLIKGGK